MTDCLIQKLKDYWDTDQMHLRGRRNFDVLNIKSKFALINTDQFISITDITCIEHGHFLKTKIDERFIFLKVTFCCPKTSTEWYSAELPCTKETAGKGGRSECLSGCLNIQKNDGVVAIPYYWVYLSCQIRQSLLAYTGKAELWSCLVQDCGSKEEDSKEALIQVQLCGLLEVLEEQTYNKPYNSVFILWAHKKERGGGGETNK